MRRTNGVDTNNNLNDFSTNSTPLPIELLDFRVRRQDKQVAIEWVTAREQNNHQFFIERSADGRNYEEIASVQGAGNSSLLQNYLYTDANPLAGVNYYRLRQVDFDGKFEYSPVQSVRMGGAGTATLLPNPLQVGNALTLLYDSNTETGLDIAVFNAMGQQLVQYQIEVQKGDNQLRIDLSQLTSGLYTLRIQNGQEAPQSQQLLVK
jgi:hypothetical protein